MKIEIEVLPSKTKALFYNLVAPILGWNCVKDLTVTNIAKQIKFEEILGKFEARNFAETIIHNIFETKSSFQAKPKLLNM